MKNHSTGVPYHCPGSLCVGRPRAPGWGWLCLSPRGGQVSPGRDGAASAGPEAAGLLGMGLGWSGGWWLLQSEAAWAGEELAAF